MREEKFIEMIERHVPIPGRGDKKPRGPNRRRRVMWCAVLSHMEPGDSILLDPQSAHNLLCTINNNYPKLRGLTRVEGKLKRVWVLERE